jgi:hypothetical protein
MVRPGYGSAACAMCANKKTAAAKKVRVMEYRLKTRHRRVAPHPTLSPLRGARETSCDVALIVARPLAFYACSPFVGEGNKHVMLLIRAIASLVLAMTT